jgi:cytochrome b561
MDGTPNRWSKLVAGMHWASALLILILIVAGFRMVGLDPADPMRRIIGRVHTISGVLLGLVTVARLVVRRRTPAPEPLDATESHRKGVAIVHALLYVVSLATIATGLGTVLRVRDQWHGYLLGELPKPPAFDAFVSRQAHEVLAILLVVLVGVHVIGAVVQEVRKGGALRRIVPFMR